MTVVVATPPLHRLVDDPSASKKRVASNGIEPADHAVMQTALDATGDQQRPRKERPR